ncbi:MAG: hypothetical protein AAF892_04580 [Cyanobacteria bacterium P01_D01_bin.71]
MRPKPGAAVVSDPVVPEAVSETAPATAEAPPKIPTNHPIAPPSEPMQYRAIGLVKGTYQPSEEQLNRGDIVTEDGTTVSAVLLGRVTSLIKKHIDLTASHLWVVYPRTRQPAEDEEENATESGLHLQIVGVWEPDTLGLPGENPKTKADSNGETDETDSVSDETNAEASEATEIATAVSAEPVEPTADTAGLAVDAPPVEEESLEAVEEPSENYFSIRGEVLNYDEESEIILVKIVQGSKRSGKPPKAFKLNLFGQITGKTVGYFWEFDIERQSEKLVVTEGRPIRMVPPKKKKKRKSFGPRRGPRGAGDRPSRPSRNTEKPRIRPPAPVKSNPL